MHPYVLLPLAAALVAVAIAGAAWARDPAQPANRLSAALMLAVAFWSLCDAASQAAATAEASVRAGRMATAGLLWCGPLLVHLHRLMAPQAVPRLLDRGLRLFYAVTPLGIVAGVTTPLFIAGAERLPWGWAPVFGPGLPAVLLWIAAYPLWIVCASHREAPARMVGPTARWLLLALVLVALASELAYPLLGLRVPALGTSCVSAAAAFLVLGFYREGRRFVAPRRLAQELLDAFPDGIALRNADGTIRSANANLARLVGCPREALRGSALAKVLPDPRLRDLDGEAVLDLQTSLTTRSGEAIPVSASTSLLCSREGYAIGRVVSVRDLRPVLELRAHLVTAGRLAAVGELAASITHEINNPVAFVRTNLGLLERHLQEVAKVAEVVPCAPGLGEAIAEGREVVAETLDGADRVADIVRDVRSFSGAGHQEREATDVNRLCEEALRVSLPRIPEGVSVYREYRDVASVPSDPRALVQVLLNLITNAAQAVTEHGTIWISTEAADDGLLVRVADDGGGIPPHVMERIFDPFFTTKPVGEGTGLGLAISRQIIEHQGGSLSVEERDGGGTVFVVRLPVAPAGSPPSPEEAG